MKLVAVSKVWRGGGDRRKEGRGIGGRIIREEEGMRMEIRKENYWKMEERIMKEHGKRNRRKEAGKRR